MAQFGTLSSIDEMPASSGTCILNGTVPPANATGAPGDFYMDTVGKILYGPKGGEIDTYVMKPSVPAGTTSGPGNYTWGLRVRFLVPVTVTALRYYRSASATVPTRTLTLYRAGASVASVISPGEAGAGWKTVPLATPVVVDLGVDYVAAYHTGNDSYVESTGTPASNAATHVTNFGGCWAAGTSFPSNNVPNNIYFADLVFRSAWPIAIKSA